VGACKGAEFVFNAFLATALLGGILSLIFLAYRGLLLKTIKQLFASLKVFVVSRFTAWNFLTLAEQPEASFPYGLAIVLGTILTYWVV